jgi:mannose-6-phosphate isomerase-like protein (cupin superfamily)
MKGPTLSAYSVLMQSSSFVVKSDVDRWGQQIVPSVSAWVKISSKDTGGAWSMFEGVVAPQFGPPLHLHFCQEEWFHIVRGEFIFEAGGEQHRMTPGMSIFVPRLVRHRFQNIGSSTGKVLILAQPAGTLEEFFDRFSKLSERELAEGNKVIELFADHGMQVVGPPLPALLPTTSG